MSRLVKLRELENFVAVADHGSVTAGAIAVGVSQPAVSASLKNLERNLGVSLLVRRRGTGVSLTPEGALLAAEARPLLSRASEVANMMIETANQSKGVLHVGSLVTVAPIVVPALVRQFGEANPNIEIRLRIGAQDQLLSWLRAGDIHLAVTYDMELGHDVDFVPVLDARPHVALPAQHPQAAAESLELGELVDEPYIMLDLPLSRQYFTSLFLAAEVPCRPSARHPDLSLIRSLVGNGFGFSLVNLLPAPDTAQDGTRVAYVKLTTSVKPLVLGMARRSHGVPPRSLETFTEFAKSAIAHPGVLRPPSVKQ